MSRFIEGDNRHQINQFHQRLDECIDDENPAHAIDAFVDGLGFKRVEDDH